MQDPHQTTTHSRTLDRVAVTAAGCGEWESLVQRCTLAAEGPSNETYMGLLLWAGLGASVVVLRRTVAASHSSPVSSPGWC